MAHNYKLIKVWFICILDIIVYSLHLMTVANILQQDLTRDHK